MNILSYILNYEIKKLFINDILEKIKNKIMNAILLVFSNFSENIYLIIFLFNLSFRQFSFSIINYVI